MLHASRGNGSRERRGHRASKERERESGRDHSIAACSKGREGEREEGSPGEEKKGVWVFYSGVWF